MSYHITNGVPFKQVVHKKQNSLKDLDTDYMAAVESGDMETAQRMVDEAAEAAMPDSILREGMAADNGEREYGKLIKMYHGSGAKEFYKFRLNDGALGKGAYFSYTMG